MTEVTHGFELLRDEAIPELNTRARIWRHARTGAQLLSLENDDENKVFGISFRTPPTDSTGLPHILEHVVLAGSQKYPLKDPFFELVKGSLASFVNAMTYPDKTIYPAASTNLQDFYNLLDVYVDAVFHPLLSPEKLAQEGWHHELEAADAPLTYKGVVFNEMKGAYSSPDSLLDRYSRQATFPDTTYGVDSGGDPAVIPDLTYEQFKRFHETYYHPSNALLFFYGDDDPEERLRLMDGYLSEFEAIEVDSAITPQTPFAAPQVTRFPYGADGEQDGGEPPKAFVEVNWLLPEYEAPALVMALEIVAHALLGTPASPLRKALIDAGLGEDVLGGLANDTRQMTFSAGLKGVAPADAGRVEPLILATLSALAQDGFDPDMIGASVNTIEFALRENNTGRYPRGLALLVRALDTWLHDRDPLAPLAFEAPLATVKQRLAAEPDYPQSLIREYLLDNPHRVTVILEPDAELNRRLEEAERARLAQERAAMSDDDVAQVIAQARMLQEQQNLPDPPEVLAKLPSLKRGDLEPRHKPIPLALDAMSGARVVYHDLFTNGIVYLDLGLDLRALPAALLPYAGLFGQALLEMGTDAEDFVKLSQRIGRTTGGIYPTTLIAPVVEETTNAELRTTSAELLTATPSELVVRRSSLVAYLMLRGKATPARAPELLGILGDVLAAARLDNRERFRQIVLEAKIGAESGLVPAGHQVTNTRLRGHFHPAYRVEEMVNGVENLLFLRRLAERIDSDWSGVLADLEAVRGYLVNRTGMIANVTLDEANYTAFAPQLAEFIGGLPGESSRPVRFAENLTDLPGLPRHEGLTIPAQVNYVGKGADLYQLGYRLDGSIAVINNLLRTGYLLQKIRIQGGAYGAFCTFSPISGVYTYLSYRDPNLTGTLDVYDATAAYLRGLELSDDELTRSIIGAIGAIDAYQLPDAKGYTSLTRYLTGETDARLQQFRDEVLGTTTADFRALAEVLAAVKDAGDVVVLGSREAAEASELGLAVTKVM